MKILTVNNFLEYITTYYYCYTKDTYYTEYHKIAIFFY